jgi:archaemetzincin
MDQQKIALISFGIFEKDMLAQLADDVRLEFGFSVIIKEGYLDLSEFYDPVRRQYNGNNLLRMMDLQMMESSVKTIGLFNVDLFIPILTYIFGQAVLGGQTGIASLYRLYNERYGMPADHALLAERFKKEVIHELGHTFGLIHCFTPNCVMKSSTYMEDIDLKESHLCPKCRSAAVQR